MILENNKEIVIDNIKEAIEDGELNKKVEIGDPNLSQADELKITERFLKNRNKILYKINNKFARTIVYFGTNIIHKETEIIGLENIKNIDTGAIITSNHFSPIDTTILQKLIRNFKNKRLYIVSQVSNFAMTGFVGFMMNYSDTIPVNRHVGYMKKEFANILQEKLLDNDFVLIYPEEEMWLNYKKPRPLKPGAYYYASKNNVPIISCFTEMIDTNKKLKYVLHILNPIYPDPDKRTKENVEIMMKMDYEQKKEAYEKAYNKKLDYEFELSDIAGLIKA